MEATLLFSYWTLLFYPDTTSEVIFIGKRKLKLKTNNMQAGGFKITWVTVLIAIGSLSLGAYLNYLSNLESNKKLFAQIKEELDKLKTKQQTAGLAKEEDDKIKELEGSLRVLEQKI